jgi:hypothetical protein
MWPFRKRKERPEDVIQAIAYVIDAARAHERECTHMTHDTLRFYARICFEVALGRAATEVEELSIVGTFYAPPEEHPEIPF